MKEMAASIVIVDAVIKETESAFLLQLFNATLLLTSSLAVHIAVRFRPSSQLSTSY